VTALSKGGEEQGGFIPLPKGKKIPQLRYGYLASIFVKNFEVSPHTLLHEIKNTSNRTNKINAEQIKAKWLKNNVS